MQIFSLSPNLWIGNTFQIYTDILCLLAPVFAVNVFIRILHHKFLRKKKEKKRKSLFLTFQDEHSFELPCEINFRIFNQL